jgi:hypothetical protein
VYVIHLLTNQIIPKPRIRKEYPNMAKAKSPSGSKRKDETVVNNAAALPPVTEPAKQTSSLEPAPSPKTNGGRDATKLSVVKTDSRATVMPINLEDEIRRRAYELSERRGFSSGHEAEDWLTAESEIRIRYRQHSA